MLRNKILVTSQPNESTIQFVKDLFKVSNNTAFPQSVVDDRLKETNGDVAGITIPYTIDTKYYTAKVDFWLDEIDPALEKETIKAYCENNTEISQVVDGFVFLFDKSKPGSWETMKAWLPFLEQVKPRIRICVGTSSKTPLDAKLDDEINDWCLSHECDYVDMDETTDIPMDKVGTELALDILQTHFWDGMVRKDVDNKTVEKDLEQDFQLLSLQHKMENDFEEDPFDLPSDSEIWETQNAIFGDFDDDDGLEKALSAIQAMREQGQNMPDEERRKMAAKVALSFAAQLGIDK